MPSPNHRNLPSIDCPLHIVEVWPERFAVRREFVGIACAPLFDKLLHVFPFGSRAIQFRL
jgi:hypothetical protein